MGETVETLRSVKKVNTNWRKEVESWEPRLKQGTIEATRKDLDLRLQHAKPILKAPRRLWMEGFTNRPVDDQIVNEWKLMKIEVGPKYTMDEIYHKVRSRWKDRWEIIWDEDLMDPWQSWGQEGHLGREEAREWIDGKRLLLIVQGKGSSLIEELMEKSELWRKLLAGRKWKKKEWLDWTEDNPGWDQEWEAPES
jgi:hypothetical protein